MAKTGWTIYDYATATDLSKGIHLNIVEKEKALFTSSNSINIITLWDQARKTDKSEPYKSGYNNASNIQEAWETTGIAELLPNPDQKDPRDEGIDRKVQTFFNLIDELNTSDPKSLKYFLETSAKDYASHDNKMFVSSDHAGGIISGFVVDSLKYDLKPAGNYPYARILMVTDLSFAIQNYGQTKKYNVIAFDSCMMGMLEVAYALRDQTHYLLASQENTAGNGLNYFSALKDLNNLANISSVDLGKRFISANIKSYEDNPEISKSNTLSLTKTSELSNVASALKDFVEAALAIDNLSPFWKNLGYALLQGTYYGGSGYQFYHDLSGFIQRASSTLGASDALIKASTNLVTALGKTVTANSISYDGINLLPGATSIPVSEASYGLSIVLPYNLNSYYNMIGKEKEDTLDKFIKDQYIPQAAEFLAATNWADFLKKLSINKVYLAKAGPTNLIGGERDGVLEKANNGKNISFYLDYDNYTSNYSNTQELNQNVYSLYELGNHKGNKLTAKDISFELELYPSSTNNITIELVDDSLATNKVLARKTYAANTEVITFNPKIINPTSAESIITDDIKLRIFASESTSYNLICNVSGSVPLVSNAEGKIPGSNRDGAIELEASYLFSPGQFLTKQRKEIWYRFNTSSLEDNYQVIHLATRSMNIINLEISKEIKSNIEGANSPSYTTKSISGIGGPSIRFKTESATQYYIKVSADFNKEEDAIVDFGLNLNYDYSEPSYQLLQATGVAPSEKFENLGLINIDNFDSTHGELSANLFLNSLPGGSSFSSVGYISSINDNNNSAWMESSGPNQIGSLNRELAQQLIFTNTLQEFHEVIKATESLSVGQNNTSVVNLGEIGSSVGIYAQLNNGQSINSISQNAGISSAAGDTLVSFADQGSLSINTGVFSVAYFSEWDSILNLWSTSVGSFEHNLVFYNVDSITGAIFDGKEWIYPNSANYAKVAIDRGLEKAWVIEPSKFDTKADSLELDGDFIALALVTCGSVEEFIRTNPTNEKSSNSLQSWFSVGSANLDGKSHFISLGSGIYGFEDLWGGGDNDFNDTVISLKPID